MSDDKKLVMDLQLEAGGEVLDLTYLPALLREIDHLMELNEAGDIQSPSATVTVPNCFETILHLRELMSKKAGDNARR